MTRSAEGGCGRDSPRQESTGFRIMCCQSKMLQGKSDQKQISSGRLLRAELVRAAHVSTWSDNSCASSGISVVVACNWRLTCCLARRLEIWGKRSVKHNIWWVGLSRLHSNKILTGASTSAAKGITIRPLVVLPWGSKASVTWQYGLTRWDIDPVVIAMSRTGKELKKTHLGQTDGGNECYGCRNPPRFYNLLRRAYEVSAEKVLTAQRYLDVSQLQFLLHFRQWAWRNSGNVAWVHCSIG